MSSLLIRYCLPVAPYTGAWIEIIAPVVEGGEDTSLPTRERGLKYDDGETIWVDREVAPYTGAWIEIGPAAPNY